MIRPQRIITLENKLADILEEFKEYHRSVIVRKLGIVIDDFVKEVGRASWMDGYSYMVANKVRYLEFLEGNEFIHPRITDVPPKYKFEKSRLDLSQAVTIDSSKLLKEFPSPYNTQFEPTHYFNNSVIKFNGKYLMSYRMDLYPFSKYTRLAMCELDERFVPIEKSNKLLDLPSKMDKFGAEDGRLFVWNDELWITYCTNYNGNNFQIVIAKINHKTFEIEQYQFLKKPFPELPEKNWLFFEHNGHLHCIYHADCMNVYRMNDDCFSKDYVYMNRPVTWDWGEVRGGASPILYDDKFYHFFHSTKWIKHKESGQRTRQFFIGLQIFENKPPFKTIALSKEPLLTRSIIDESLNCPSAQSIVYPCGAIRQERAWLISFGDSDSVCKLLSIPDDIINENLTTL